MGKAVNEITIYKRNGAVRYKLNNKTQLCAIKSAEQKRELLGEDSVQLKLTSAVPMECSIGDYIVVYGDTYTLDKAGECVKLGERSFETSYTFEGLQYKLLDAQFRNTDAAGHNPTATFSIVANLQLLMEVLITNVNRVAGTLGESWQLGECPQNTEYKDFTYSNQNCLAALQSACEEYKMEFDIEARAGKQYVLNIRKQGSIFPLTFDYSKQSGVVKLQRKNVNSGDIVTRLYVEGGTQNISKSYKYGSERLRISDNEESYVQSAEAVAAFGIKEGSKQYDDIFPHRKGRVTSIVEGNMLQFRDSNMFDLNAKDGQGNTLYLIDGTAAKVKFTGNSNLAGYEFELHKYDHATRTFTLIKYEDKRGLQLPDGGSYCIQENDEYVLLDIVMPHDPYVVDAETELKAKGEEDLQELCQPRVEYELEIASLSLERSQGTAGTIVNVFRVGDYLHIKDADINVDKAIRIKAFTRDCYSDPYKYKVTLSDIVDVSLAQKLVEDVVRHEEVIQLNNLTNVAKARASWRTTQELLNMVFDGDGFFDTANIKPASIETMMLSVGNRAGQFILRDLVITANALSNGKPQPQLLQISSTASAPVLIHYAIEEHDRTWGWNRTNTTLTLTNAGAYYIYAQCPKAAGSSFAIIATQSKLATDNGGAYYYFQIGILSSIFNGYRELTLTYGATRITGRCINCGKIESIDKSTYFDLDNGEIAGRIKFINSSGGVSNITELEEAVSGQGTSLQDLQELLGKLQTQLDGTIEYWFGSVPPALDNPPAQDWGDEDKQLHVGDIYTDTATGKEYVFSQQGEGFEWVEQQPTGLGVALQQAYNAFNTAGGKSHVFVTANESTPPTPPYKQGDMWVTLDNMRFKVCKQDSSGAYSAADWADAGYTNDAKALEALQKLTDLAADSIITPAEKIVLKQEITNIIVDYNGIHEKARQMSINTAAFDAAYNSLRAYCAPILSNMNVNTTGVNKNTYTQVFTNYYTARTNLITAIANGYTDAGLNSVNVALGQLRSTIEELQSQIDGTIEYWYGTGVPTLENAPANGWTDEATRKEHVGDMFTDTTSGLEYRFVCEDGVYGWLNVASSGIGQAIQTANEALGLANGKNHTFVTESFDNVATKPQTYKKGDLWIALNILQIRICERDSNGAHNPNDWKDIGYSDNTKALEALQELQAMADDSIITPAEKLVLKLRYEEMAADYTELALQAQGVGVTIGELEQIWAAIQEIVGAILEDMTTSSEGIDRNSFNQYFADYMEARNSLLQRINNTYTDKAVDDLGDLVDELQTQLDGTIEYWFGGVNPSLQNAPAVGWNTAKKKNWHVGDIYTNTATGTEWKFTQSGSTYKWTQQTATGVGKAIAQALSALSTANGKNHVWVTANLNTHPAPPYKQGDLWVTTADYAIRICTTAKTTGQAYALSDWQKAGYASDADMQFTLNLLQDMGSDNVISPLEKVQLQERLAEIRVDYSVCIAQAALTGTDTTAFSTAYSQLCEYLADLLDDMNESTQVDKDEYNGYFNRYYTARTQLLNSINFNYADAAVDGIVVGGDNYIKNSAYFEDTNGWEWNPTNTGTPPQPPTYNDSRFGSVLQIVKTTTSRFWIMNTANASKGGNLCLPNERFMRGATYSLAFWAKADVECAIQVGFMDATGNQAVIAPYRVYNIATAWKRCIYTFVVADDANVTHADIRLFLRQQTAQETITRMYLTRFMLVEGNKVPEWQPSKAETDDVLKRQQAEITASKQTLKAMTDNYTQIDGGLILSTMLKLGARLNNLEQWVESAGMKARLESDNEVAAYFGGTLAEAIAGTKAGMTIIYHNGKLVSRNAEITGGFDGFIRRNPLVITPSNISQYGEYDDTFGISEYYIDLEKTGRYIVFEGVVADIHMPHIDGYQQQYSYKPDEARRMVGQSVLIEAKNSTVFLKSVSNNEGGSCVSIAISNGEFVELTCIHGTYKINNVDREVIRWGYVCGKKYNP